MVGEFFFCWNSLKWFFCRFDWSRFSCFCHISCHITTRWRRGFHAKMCFKKSALYQSDRAGPGSNHNCRTCTNAVNDVVWECFCSEMVRKKTIDTDDDNDVAVRVDLMRIEKGDVLVLNTLKRGYRLGRFTLNGENDVFVHPGTVQPWSAQKDGISI